ncbi:S8 family serine peptidase [Micromonospora sp. NPDC049559]|uniref:S8 family peptidase n=1 Tax=Micromonospora sp. NPDC049559 TaxID=3155923 RepID=UPI003431BD62
MSNRRTAARLLGAGGAVALAASVVLAGAPAALAAPGWEIGAMSVAAVWPTSEGDGVTVAVVDSGIRTDHPVLKGRATEGPDQLGETDQHEKWYGLHGTAMASSVLDVAPKAKVVGYRVLRDEGDPDFTDEPVGPATGTQQKANPTRTAITEAVRSGADVISLSLGSISNIAQFYDDGVAADIAYANSKGVVVVAAAGNEGEEGNVISYPANFPGVIGVGAATPSGKAASFSNVHSYVDVLAPGTKINAADARTKGRVEIEGTSSATALVSGVVALIKSKYPDLAPRQVEQLLIQTASRYRSGHSPQTGYGMVDADAAMKAAAALKPEPAVLPAKEHGDPAHFGPGDDGTPARVGQPFDWTYVLLALGGLVPGLVMILVGALLVRSARRARRSGVPAPALPPPAPIR